MLKYTTKDLEKLYQVNSDENMIIDGKRSLAHVEKVSWIKSIDGADNIELIGVLG